MPRVRYYKVVGIIFTLICTILSQVASESFLSKNVGLRGRTLKGSSIGAQKMNNRRSLNKVGTDKNEQGERGKHEGDLGYKKNEKKAHQESINAIKEGGKASLRTVNEKMKNPMKTAAKLTFSEKKIKKVKDTSSKHESKLTQGIKESATTRDKLSKPSITEISSTPSTDEASPIDDTGKLDIITNAPDDASEDGTTPTSMYPDLQYSVSPSTSPSTSASMSPSVSPPTAMDLTPSPTEERVPLAASVAGSTSNSPSSIPSKSFSTSVPTILADGMRPTGGNSTVSSTSKLPVVSENSNTPTLSPSVAEPTTKPTPTETTCPTTVQIDSTFVFNFVFADREPTNSEISSLKNVTLQYIAQLFDEDFGNTVEEISGSVKTSQFELGPPSVFTMNLVSVVPFSSCAPMQEELNSALSLSSDELINSYLTQYVFPLENIFVLTGTLQFDGTATYVG